MKTVLLDFRHGLGDSVQLSIVLQHLQQYRPDWELYLHALPGKHSSGNVYCKEVWHNKEAPPKSGGYDQVFKLGWYECGMIYSDSPSTKAVKCLREVFSIQPDQSLLKYKLHISEEARQITGSYLDGIGATGKAVAIHYQGNTSGGKKDLNHETIAVLCETLIDSGHVPIILDWDKRSPLPDQKRVFCPTSSPGDIWGSIGTGDAERITALIDQCKGFVGIDSGPQKCAGATNTPALGIWTKHSPIHFMDVCPNFLHLVPAAWPFKQEPKASRYILENYRYQVYGDNLALAICDQAEAMLRPKRKPVIRDFVCNRPDQDFVIIQDIYLNDAYKIGLLSKRTDTEIVVDVGAHIGTFSRLYHERNPQARIFALEVCPDNLEALRANVGAFATVIPAACTYETEELFLLNSFSANCQSTGGSRVVNRQELDACNETQYWKDTRPLARMTIHQLMETYQLDRIDMLKLDCEGSEFSILENAPMEQIGFVVLESHDSARFRDLLKRRFAGWDIGHMYQNGNCETWHLRNPKAP